MNSLPKLWRTCMSRSNRPLSAERIFQVSATDDMDTSLQSLPQLCTEAVESQNCRLDVMPLHVVLAPQQNEANCAVAREQ